MQQAKRLKERSPLSLAEMPAALSATMQKSQAWGHVCSPFLCGDADRNSSLDSNNNLGNLHNHSLGENKGRHVFVSWVSPSLPDQGGDPASSSLGSEPPLLEHLALGEGMATELELQTTSYMMNSLDAEGHLVLLLDSFNQDSLKNTKLAKERLAKTSLEQKGTKNN